MVVEVFRGGSTLVVDVLALTALQRAVPKDQLGRVMGSFFAFVIGAIALGTVITPPISNVLGLDAALLIMSGVPLLLALCALPALQKVDRDTPPPARFWSQRWRCSSSSESSRRRRPLLERLASEARGRDFAVGTEIITEALTLTTSTCWSREPLT